MANSESRGGHPKGDNQLKKPQRYKSDSEHVIRKRLPPRLPRRNNDIYITNKSNYQVSIHRMIHIVPMMDGVNTSETTVNLFETVQRNILEGCHLHTRRREYLKS